MAQGLLKRRLNVAVVGYSLAPDAGAGHHHRDRAGCRLAHRGSRPICLRSRAVARRVVRRGAPDLDADRTPALRRRGGHQRHLRPGAGPTELSERSAAVVAQLGDAIQPDPTAAPNRRAATARLRRGRIARVIAPVARLLSRAKAPQPAHAAQGAAGRPPLCVARSVCEARRPAPRDRRDTFPPVTLPVQLSPSGTTPWG
jgi:hypothetical protein